MKNVLIAILFLTLGLMACGTGTDHSKHDHSDEAKTNAPSATEAKAEVKTDTTKHVHVFACPMHPEVTGKEGEKCPKCSMALEHKD